jgi:hypothetical protein
MSRQNIADAVIRGLLCEKGLKLGVLSLTLTGAYVIPSKDAPPVMCLDPGGSNRNVDLPAVTAADKGLTFIIVNTADAAEVITVRTSAGAGLTPACTPTQNETAVLIWDGAAWRHFVALGA